MSITIPTIPKLPAKGLCEHCADATCCFMPDMLEEHLSCVTEHDTWNYKDVDPGSWDACSIDLPEFEGEVITWCPMHMDISNEPEF